MEKVRARFENLVKAYDTLSNEDKFNNWVKFGNPEGSLATKAIEIALPDVLSGQSVIIFVFVGIVFMILALLTWRRGKSMFLENGIKISSKDSMHHFMMAVLTDNDNSQRDKGFTDTDIIEIFEQTEEVMTLNETQKKNHAKIFAEIVPKLAKKVNKLNRKYRPSET